MAASTEKGGLYGLCLYELLLACVKASSVSYLRCISVRGCKATSVSKWTPNPPSTVEVMTRRDVLNLLKSDKLVGEIILPLRAKALARPLPQENPDYKDPFPPPRLLPRRYSVRVNLYPCIPVFVIPNLEPVAFAFV